MENRFFFDIFSGPTCSWRHYARSTRLRNIILSIIALIIASLSLYFEGFSSLTYYLLLGLLLFSFLSIFGYQVHKEEYIPPKEFERDEVADEKFKKWLESKNSKEDLEK